MAQRIRSVVRPADTVVRWGGDEFLGLFEHLDADTRDVPVVKRILTAVADPTHCDGHERR